MTRFAFLALLTLSTASAQAQTGRQALAAGHERYLQADFRGALPLLAAGLDPNAGPLDKSWRLGVQRIVDVLLVLGQDSLATPWLRWANRLAADFAVDEGIMPPTVVRAARAARSFVDSTSQDRFAARTTFEWPSRRPLGTAATIRLARVDIPITARVGADRFLRGGESRIAPPGSYTVIVSAPGYLPARLTVELLPGVTTVVETSLLSEAAGLLYVAARPWGELFVDGARVGYTPVSLHRVAPGRHALRLVRRGQPAIDTVITVGEREAVRLSWGAHADAVASSRLDSAITTLDAGGTETGIALLRRLLDSESSASPALRVTAHAQLAVAMWSLGDRDSARVHLRESVTADPHHLLPPDLFNPELLSAYVAVRRAMIFVSLRAPADTVLYPFHDVLPVRIAVGRPGAVRVFLHWADIRRRSSLLFDATVDSMAAIAVPLVLVGDSTVLQPGSYVLEASLVGGEPGASDRLELVVARRPVDTLPHMAPLQGHLLQPEKRRGPPSPRTILESASLGIAAMFVMGIANDADLSGRRIPIAAVLVGATAAIVNATHDRASVAIPAAVARNDSLRSDWAEQARAAVTENERRLRASPLTIRARRVP